MHAKPFQKKRNVKRFDIDGGLFVYAFVTVFLVVINMINQRKTEILGTNFIW